MHPIVLEPNGKDSGCQHWNDWVCDLGSDHAWTNWSWWPPVGTDTLCGRLRSPKIFSTRMSEGWVAQRIMKIWMGVWHCCWRGVPCPIYLSGLPEESECGRSVECPPTACIDDNKDCQSEAVSSQLGCYNATWTYSPYNSPVCPTRKPNKKCWLRIDYQILKWRDPTFGCCCPWHAPAAVPAGRKTSEMLYHHEYGKCTLLHSHSRVIQTTVFFHLIYLESIIHRVET